MTKIAHVGKASSLLHIGARIVVLVVAFSVLAPGAGEAAGTVTLAWDQNSDGVTIGYVVSYGTQSGRYTGAIDVGGATFAVINVADSTPTYYFVVQAYA